MATVKNIVRKVANVPQKDFCEKKTGDAINLAFLNHRKTIIETLRASN